MKKALIVGINDYAPIGAGGPDLRGCVNDARDMANTLVICGFPPANIRILTDRNATNKNILTYLTWLLKGCAAGDSLVFYYSGHGTRLANIGPDIELDGLDEAICPHDYATAGCIRDDSFNAIFTKLLKPKVNLDVVLDSCFSGTGTRNLAAGLDADEQPVYTGIRFVPPMLDDEFYFTFANQIEKFKKPDELIKTNKAIVLVPGMNHVLWAACKDNQVSMEGNLGGSIRGYFTYNFCKVLRATNGNIARNIADRQVANALAAMGANQTNQTEGTRTELAQKIFM